MKLTASTSWFSPPRKIGQVLQLLAASGYSTVEIAGTRENLKSNPSELAKTLRETSMDVACLSIGVPFSRDPTNLNLHSKNETIRSNSLKYVFECIDYASELAAKFVYVCSLIKEELGQTRQDAYTIFRSSLSKCAEYGEKSGILVALEHFPSGLCPSISDTHQLISPLDGVGLVFDIGHEALCKRPIDLPIQDQSLIFDVHLNNNDGTSDRHWVPNTGVIEATDYIKIFDRLHSIGYNGNLTLELANVQEDGSELSFSKSFIDSLLLQKLQDST